MKVPERDPVTRRVFLSSILKLQLGHVNRVTVPDRSAPGKQLISALNAKMIMPLPRQKPVHVMLDIMTLMELMV